MEQRAVRAADEATLAEAAKRGDRAALSELIRRCLPVVYSVVRRRTSGPDADDVVQETFLRAVRHISSVQDPARFRSWVLAIAVRESNRRHCMHSWEFDQSVDEDIEGVADTVDQERRILARMALSEQRREIAEATGWLDSDDRDLLALWWLELAGELDREQLAAAAELAPGHLRVRLQRLRERLDLSRAIIRVLRLQGTAHGCAVLADVAAGWNGTAAPLWRKRLARHLDECEGCGRARHGLVPADRLLSGVPLLVAPPALADAVGTATAQMAASKASIGARPKPGHVGKVLAGKPAAVAAATATILTLSSVYAYSRAQAPAPRESTTSQTVVAAPTTSLGPSPVGSVSAPPVSSPADSPLTRYVSAKAPNGGNGSFGRPFNSLSQACAAVPVNGTLRLAAGAYDLGDKTCDLAKGASLIGAGQNAGGSTITGSAPILIRVQNATERTNRQQIARFALRGGVSATQRGPAETGLWLNRLYGLDVHHLTVQNFRANGIKLADIVGSKFHDLTLNNNAEDRGNGCSGNFTVGNLTDTTITNLTARDNIGYGIKASPIDDGAGNTSGDLRNSRVTMTNVVWADIDIAVSQARCAKWNTLGAEFWNVRSIGTKMTRLRINAPLSLGQLGSFDSTFEVSNSFFDLPCDSRRNMYAVEAGMNGLYFHDNYVYCGLYTLYSEEGRDISQRFRIENNVIDGASGPGVFWMPQGMENATFTGNTVISKIRIFNLGDTRKSSITLRDNIFLSRSAAQRPSLGLDGPGLQVTADHNLFTNVGPVGTRVSTGDPFPSRADVQLPRRAADLSPYRVAGSGVAARAGVGGRPVGADVPFEVG
ncbi:ECF subfamily RNA polymerase sigma-24 subunit [Actinoplanes sp. SE50]|uniref:sigma-70 family RNA polymerase sigma factor n=1 Tax=unclassified Actinoplanes TaxID=2626549 RepID=UPI00023ECA16|nr:MULTISPECIES: sigma-70 family RNA polymerase sigma factor [unclassified Actinoplanes]AEV87101.1 RNA polymerase, sigma-24 subunit, ECF subfamily [Actinoplanes sp. SE50/110]ATO85499.1 ECF subfamily RNA polymerase sigma-24 subunit [Actinoplanes sp. SE50]SLM02911.1 ECF subfamily RNA polymerase sigma-24 subunit [Actinoplanes sp. SE50/110]